LTWIEAFEYKTSQSIFISIEPPFTSVRHLDLFEDFKLCQKKGVAKAVKKKNNYTVYMNRKKTNDLYDRKVVKKLKKLQRKRVIIYKKQYIIF